MSELSWRLGRVLWHGAIYLARWDGGHSASLLAVEAGLPTSDVLRESIASKTDLWGCGFLQAPIDECRWLAPVRSPSSVWAIGLNYADHARESGMTVPRQPTFFMKSPSSLVGPGDAIWSNPSEEPSVDAEVELAIVIGRSIGPRDVGKASSAILGYSIANDVSARSFQAQDGQWCRAKSIDTFCPLGPWIVSPAAVDPNARLRSTINGEALQDGSLRDMICSPAEAVAYLSRWITLRPGDVILTGTPSGVGFARRPPVLLRPGDDVRVSIDGIGHLQNVVEERSVGSDWIAGSK